MNALSSLVQSSIGKKVIMGVTGFVMIGWVTIHMAGHFIMFSGQDAYNAYAHFIQSGFGVEPALLWILRLVMLGAIGAHIWAAVALTRLNAAARPVAYAGGRQNRITGYPALLMRVGGIFLLLYLLFHLAHLTGGAFSGSSFAMAGKPFVREDAYANMVHGLSNPVVGLIYLAALAALGAHLKHGVWSAFQTLGLGDPRWDFVKVGLGNLLPVVVAGGFALVVIVAMAGGFAPPDPSWAPPAHWLH